MERGSIGPTGLVVKLVSWRKLWSLVSVMLRLAQPGIVDSGSMREAEDFRVMTDDGFYGWGFCRGHSGKGKE